MRRDPMRRRLRVTVRREVVELKAIHEFIGGSRFFSRPRMYDIPDLWEANGRLEI